MDSTYALYSLQDRQLFVRIKEAGAAAYKKHINPDAGSGPSAACDCWDKPYSWQRGQPPRKVAVDGEGLLHIDGCQAVEET